SSDQTTTTTAYTLSLHDALPICLRSSERKTARELQQVHRFAPVRTPYPSSIRDTSRVCRVAATRTAAKGLSQGPPRLRLKPYRQDRKSTRLNSSHVAISYAVFCL